MTVGAPSRSPSLSLRGIGSDRKAIILAAAGLFLTFAAPHHRVDLLLVGLAATVGGIWWNPMTGPALIGAALPFFFFSRPLVGPLSVSPPGLALILSWLIPIVRRSTTSGPAEIKMRWPRTSYEAPLSVFLAAALLSLLVTEYPPLSVRDLRAVILEPVVFFWLLYAIPSSPIGTLGGFLFAATLTAATAVLQGPLGAGGTQAEGVLRAQAWYPSANHLALMLGRAWPFLLAGALAYRRWLWAPAALVGLALVQTFSTGGWLGALAGLLAVLASLRRGHLALRLGGAAAAVLILVSGLAIAGVLPERLNPLRQTTGFRVDLWLSSVQMLRDHPLLGIGLDNFAYLYQHVYLRAGGAAEPNLSHPHNWLLQFWLELGLLGLVAFVWLLVRFWRLARASRASSSTWMVAGAMGAMADLLVHGLIDNSYFLVDLAFLFWLGLALADHKSSPEGERSKLVARIVAK